MRFLKRRPFMSVAFGAVLAVAFLVLVRPGLLRDARAQGAHMLNYTAALVNAAQGDAAAVQKQGCRYDTTPEVVADGDVHAVRCDAEGDQFVNVNTIPLTEVQGDQVTPAAQTTVACDDTGAVAFTANAASVRLEIWNAGVNDVCLRWGTAGTPDRTTLTSCSFVLGAYAGGGTSTIYVTPADFRVASEAFECDAAAATNLVVVDWRTE